MIKQFNALTPSTPHKDYGRQDTYYRFYLVCSEYLEYFTSTLT